MSEVVLPVSRSLGTRILRGAAAGLLLNLFTNFFLFVGQLIIPRALSQLEYAHFTVAISFVTVFAIFADLGLTPLFTRLLAEAHEDSLMGNGDNRGKLLGSMFALRLGLACIVSLAVVLVAPTIYPQPLAEKMWILLITLFISSRIIVVRAVGDSFLRSIGKYSVSALFMLFDAAAFALLLMIGERGGLTLNRVIWIYSCCHIPGFILLFVMILRWKRRQKIQFEVDWSVILKVLRVGIPLGIGTAFLTLHNESDKLLLDYLSTPVQVADFGATMRLCAAASPIAVILAAVTAPELTRLIRRGDLERSQRMIDLGLRFLLCIGVGIALFLQTSSSAVTTLFLGAKYASAGHLLAYVGWMLIPIFFATYMIEVAIAAGKLWYSTIYAAIIMVAVILGDIVLVGRYGAFGAMSSKLSAIILGSLFLLFSQRRSEYFDISRFIVLLGRLGLCILLSIGALFVFTYLGFQSWGLSGLILLVYVLSIYAVRVLTIEQSLSILNKLRGIS